VTYEQWKHEIESLCYMVESEWSNQDCQDLIEKTKKIYDKIKYVTEVLNRSQVERDDDTGLLHEIFDIVVNHRYRGKDI